MRLARKPPNARKPSTLRYRNVRGGIECLEARQLLAADLTAHWSADDLQVQSPTGEPIQPWQDRIGQVVATPHGDPELLPGVLNGRSTVRFEAADGVDGFLVDKRSSPITGVEDFSVAVTFRTATQQLRAGSGPWFDFTGIVDSNVLGFSHDWGIAMDPQGRITAGLGGGFGNDPESIVSDVAGLNDGALHTVVFSNSGGTLGLMIDDAPPVQMETAITQPRDPVHLNFGGTNDRPEGGFTGELADIRTFNGALTVSEMEALRAELSGYYNNAPPEVQDDQYATDEDVALLVNVPGVLANDSDAEGETLTAELVSAPQHGELSLRDDGSFIYAPQNNFFGVDQFQYVANDFRASDVATVRIEVRPVLDTAIATPDQYKARPDEPLNVPGLVGLLQNDENPDALQLRAVLASEPEFGQLTLHPDGGFQFDPQGQAGLATFTYQADNGTELSQAAPVLIVVNTIPLAIDDQFQVSEDVELVVSAEEGLTANDIDPDGDKLSVTIIDEPQQGTLSASSDGSFTYQPNANYFGPDRFTYQVRDGVEAGTVAVVELQVVSENDPPEPGEDAYFVDIGESLTVFSEEGVLRNDTDVESTVLQAEVATLPTNGQLQLDADGAFRYQPNAGFQGEDRFEYNLLDQSGGVTKAGVTIYVGQSPLRVSEIMAANASYIETATRLDADDRFPREGDFIDWIEIQNLSTGPFDISGYHLTDDPDRPRQWQFPPGTIVPGDGYLLVYASGLDITDTALDREERLHTNFKLDAEDGDHIALTAPDGTVLHDYGPEYPLQLADVSYGLLAGNLSYLLQPTPGEANQGATASGVMPVATADVPGGYYESDLQVNLETVAADATIRYTLDGSTPSESNGVVFEEPITLDATTVLRARVFAPGQLASYTTTYSYIYLDQVLEQPEDPEGFPARWGSAGNADYEMDPRVATDENSPFYNPDVRPALQSHPSISLVLDNEFLFDSRDGLYSNPQREGVAWERPASMEWISADGQQLAQVNAGLRMQGAASRNPNRPKHNMRLLFKEIYGESKLEFPIFENSDVDRYDTIILRGGNGDSWFHPNSNQQRDAQYIRDQWHRQTQQLMGHLAIEQKYIHLYINGLYWGMYHIFEKPNANFFAEHFGGEPEEYDVIQHRGGVVDGSRDGFNELLDRVRDEVNAETYAYVQENIDMPAFVDYLLINFFSGNVDWDQNNWFGGRHRENGKWRFFTWDAERSFLSPTDNRTGVNNRNEPSEIHQRLSRLEEYQIFFADRVHKLFFNDGLLTSEAGWQRWEALAEEIELPLAAESARWGDNKRRARPYTPENEWKAQLEFLEERYFAQRDQRVLDQLRSRGMYPDTVAPSFNQPAGEIEVGSTLTMNAPDGTIYFTTDGSDPRLPGGALNPEATVYSDALLLSGDVTVKARVLADSQWSALNEATYLLPAVPADADNLRISEVHYHPGPVDEQEQAAGFDDADEFEFLELVNIGQQPVDLSAVRLLRDAATGAGVDFNFADSSIQRLIPGQRVLVVENVDAFAQRYGQGLPVAGQWGGRLSNGQETVSLVGELGTIQQFSYQDEWYPQTDGVGASLEAIDERAADLALWSLAEGWQPSQQQHGTPGRPADLAPIAGDSNRDGRFDSKDLILVFSIGEYEDDIDGNSTFEEGDWNLDGDFTTRDLLFAWQQGTFVV